MEKTNLHNDGKYDEKFTVDFFYDKFDKEFLPKQLGLKGKRKTKIDKVLYKKIIIEYFDVYMKELYFLNNDMYFLFGGRLSMCHTKTTIRRILVKNQMQMSKKNPSIILFWYLRPTKLFTDCVKLIKLTGSTNRMDKIEKMFKANFDVELLPKFDSLIAKVLKIKQFYNS